MIGRTISHYEIVEKLGEGGMGVVYKARDTHLNRLVALKVLPPETMAQLERRQRFVQEARAASALQHPNIITIYDIDRADGAGFIAMEYVKGKTLEQAIGRRGMRMAEALKYAVQMADALAAAHAAGIVHRDFKPSNVMINEAGLVKVLDFGVAKLTEPTSGDELAETETVEAGPRTEEGTILGTAAYMSPEQAEGRKVDARSDIFSFGSVLYEMVTGRRPFHGGSKISTMSAILKEEPAPVSSITPEAPAELERIISRCLRKDAARRFQLMEDVKIALEELKEETDSGRSQAHRPALARSAKRHQTALIAASGVVAAALTAYWLLSRQPIQSVAVLPFVNVGGDPETEYLSDGITENLIYSLSRLPGLKVISRTSVFRYKGREADPQAAGRELGVRAVLVGRIVHRQDSLAISAELIDTQDKSVLWGEQYNRKPTDLLVVPEEMSRKISEKLRIASADQQQRQLAKRQTENNEAYQLYLKGRFYWNRRTEEMLKKGIDCFEQAIQRDPNYALAYTGLADSYNLLSDYNAMPPREGFPRAKQAAARALQIDPTLGEAATSLAWTTYRFDWDWSGAEQQFRRAIQLNPGYATAHHWYADLLTALGRTDEALTETRRALELDPLSLIMSRDVGWHYYYGRRYDQAIEQLRRTLEMDPNFVPARTLLGRAYVIKGMYAEGIAEFERAIALSGQRSAREMLAYANAAAGRRAEASKMLSEIQDNARQSYTSPFWIATIYTALGDKDHAFAWFDKAYDGRDANVAYFKVDPKLDSLRSDARYAAMVKKLRLGE